MTDDERKTQIERAHWVKNKCGGWRLKIDLLSARAYLATFTERPGFRRGARVTKH